MKSIILIIALFTSTILFSQNLKESGIRMLFDEVITNTQLNQIIAFDFKEYRKEDHSIIIKIIDGPSIELLSISEMKTGKKPISNGAQKIKIPLHQDKGEPVQYKEVEIFKVTTINIFNSQGNATK